jgi:E3 ubiquitin-protein ligase RNF13
MKNAMKAGFDGMIVYNVETSNRKNYSFAHFPTISAFEGIPAVLVSNEDGVALKNKFSFEKGYYIVVTPDFPQNLISYLLPFALVIGICLLIMISFMVIKCIRDRQKSRRHRLSSKHLKKLPTTKFKKGQSISLLL